MTDTLKLPTLPRQILEAAAHGKAAVTSVHGCEPPIAALANRLRPPPREPEEHEPGSTRKVGNTRLLVSDVAVPLTPLATIVQFARGPEWWGGVALFGKARFLISELDRIPSRCLNDFQHSRCCGSVGMDSVTPTRRLAALNMSDA